MFEGLAGLLGSGGGGYGSLLSIGGGLLYNLLNNNRSAASEVPALQQMVDAAAQSQRYAQASANPNDPIFKNLSALTEEGLRRSIIQGLTQLYTSDARARARGAPGVLANPERRDETRARAISQGFANAKQQAQEQAGNTLLRAAQGITGAAGPLRTAADIQQRYGQLAANRNAAIAQGGSAFGGALLKALTGGGRETPLGQSMPAGLPAGAIDLGSAMPWLGANAGLPAGAVDLGSAMPWLDTAFA